MKKLFRKNRGGGRIRPPPPRRWRVNGERLKSFLFQRYASVRRNSLMIVSSLTIHDDPGRHKFWAVTPLNVLWGHSKSPNCLLITFDWEEIQTWEIGSLCLSHQGASDDVQYDLFGSTWIMTRPWYKVKFWSWPFKVILYIFRRALTRETRWYKINFLLCYMKSCFRKAIFEKYHHFDIDYLWSLTQWPHLKSVDKTLPGFFQGYLMILADLFYHGFRYVNDCLSKYAKLGKIWHLVTSGDLNFGLGKIWPELFRKNFVRDIEHFFRFSLQCLNPPPPRTIPSLLEPARNRIKTLGDTYLGMYTVQLIYRYLLVTYGVSMCRIERCKNFPKLRNGKAPSPPEQKKIQ